MPEKRKRVAVVGTSTDYIEWIRSNCPEEALFITDFLARHEAAENTPAQWEEVLCDLDNTSHVLAQTRQHLEKWDMTLDGVACFDCESLQLAAEIADVYGLAYPSMRSIMLSRDKQESKAQWRSRKVPCPAFLLTTREQEAWNFSRRHGGQCVLKPVAGSGSELVFHCTSEIECSKALRVLRKQLGKRSEGNVPLYRTNRKFLVEEWVDGDEYSCDFQIIGNQITVVRLTGKLLHPDAEFGTVLAYVLLRDDDVPSACRQGRLEKIVLKAATALGIDNAICMADFKIRGEEIILLEVTPRPGGDCIPHLLKAVSGYDMLAQSLYFARHHTMNTAVRASGEYGVGLRLLADREGMLQRIDTAALQNESNILDISITKAPGHHITLPPLEYDSRHLGYVIFHTRDRQSIMEQCLAILRRIVVEIV